MTIGVVALGAQTNASKNKFQCGLCNKIVEVTGRAPDAKERPDDSHSWSSVKQ